MVKDVLSGMMGAGISKKSFQKHIETGGLAKAKHVRNGMEYRGCHHPRVDRSQGDTYPYVCPQTGLN